MVNFGIKMMAVLCTSFSCTSFSCYMGTLPKQPLNLATNENEVIYESFSSFPEDWILYDKADIAYTTSKVENNEVIISHTYNDKVEGESARAHLYYGSFYKIEGLETYEDFTFTMDFKIDSSLNESRFVGVAYHTNEVNGYLNGLFMNYRMNGQSASSVIYSNGSFKDDSAKQGPSLLSDGKYHQLTITMEGNTVKHYMDTHLVTQYDASTKYTNDLLGSSFPKTGGFAILANKCTMRIKKIRITPNAEKVEEKEEEKEIDLDEQLVKTYQYDKKNLINFPTVVSKVESSEDLETLKNSVMKPSNVILRMNKDQNIVDKEGNAIASFESIYLDVLKKDMIPVVEVEEESEAIALISFLNNKHHILDMAVYSKRDYLVQKVRQGFPKIRGIISYEDQPVTMGLIVRNSNENLANVAVLSKSQANQENINYIQARFKTVWVQLDDNDSDLTISNMINSSCYGLISHDYQHIYNVFDTYEENSYIHPVFNAGHRGLPNSCNENSVSGVKAAMKAGATHLELDCYLTKDNRVVMMHNRNIEGATNGTGNVDSFTLDELRQYKLNKFGLEEIPTLEDIFDAMKEKEDVVLILEFKSFDDVQNPIRIRDTVQCVKQIIDNYKFQDRVVFISFNIDFIDVIRSLMPNMSVAYLNSNRYIGNTLNEEAYAPLLTTMCEHSMIYDFDYTNKKIKITKEFNEQFLRDRGSVGWYWTFENTSSLENNVPSNGYLGVTTDCPDYYSNYVKYVKGIEVSLESGATIGVNSPIKLKVEKYNGTEEDVEGKVFKLEDQGDYYDVIASYTVRQNNKDYIYYTQVFKIHKYKEAVNPGGSTSSSQSSQVTSSETSSSASSSITSFNSNSHTSMDSTANSQDGGNENNVAPGRWSP